MNDLDDIESKIFEWAKEYAQKNDLKINPDYDIVVLAIKGFAQNKRDYGIQYCGCREVTGNLEKDKDIICPCVHRNLVIRKKGSCRCGLFVK